MDYARNKVNGNIEEAASALKANAYVYECPVCNTPVNLRGGKIKKKYFSHVNGLANNDCENYHPSNYSTDAFNPITFQTGIIDSSQLAFRPNFIVSIDENECASFYIKLPYLRNVSWFDGEVLFDGKFGQKTINKDTFIKDIYLPVNLSNHTYEFAKTGNVPHEIWQFLELGINGVNKESNTIFSYSISGGKKLDTSEAIYRGNEYLVVFHVMLPSQRSLERLESHIDVTRVCYDSDEWLIYKIKLPENVLRYDLEQCLSNLIKNPIKDKPPEIKFYNTYPTHISKEGTFVFPKSTENIWLQYSNPQLSISVVNKSFCKIKSENFTEDYLFQVYFESEPEGEICICINDDPVLYITFEGNKLYNPRGIIIRHNDCDTELYSAKDLLELPINDHSSIEIILPTSKANIIKINGKKLDSEKEFFNTLSKYKNNVLIEADNFGYLLIRDKVSTANRANSLPEEIYNNIQHIISLSSLQPNGRKTFFPCQDSSWWNRMPTEVLVLRTGCWSANYLPILISLKNKLHNIYGN